MNEVIDNILAKTKWLEFIEREYPIKDKTYKWSFVRRSSKEGISSAVIIVPRTKLTRSFIVIKQYRATLNDYIYAFPAGLIDEGENLEKAALRELKEETGYTGEVTFISGPIASSSGLTDEIVNIVYVDADEEPFVKPSLEVVEDITVEKFRPEFIDSLLSKNEKDGIIFDAKLYCILKEINGA